MGTTRLRKRGRGRFCRCFVPAWKSGDPHSRAGGDRGCEGAQTRDGPRQGGLAGAVGSSAPGGRAEPVPGRIRTTPTVAVTELQCAPWTDAYRCAGHPLGPSVALAVSTPMADAAFFDLDKTIIAGSSAFAFSRQFLREGLISRRTVLRSGYAQLLLLVAGADESTMDQLRRRITTLCAGWDVAQVRSVVAQTLHETVQPLVYAEAQALIGEHRAQGDEIVVLSASGQEVVEPIAAMIGADRCLATRMGVADGRYTG